MTFEMFPTAIRAQGGAWAGSLANIAAFLAPYVPYSVSDQHCCAVPLLLNLLSEVIHWKVSWFPLTKVKEQKNRHSYENDASKLQRSKDYLRRFSKDPTVEGLDEDLVGGEWPEAVDDEAGELRVRHLDRPDTIITLIL